jgi:hypothetical protein
MNRIQINGVWYVPEYKQPEEDVEFDPFDPGNLTFFRGCVYETDSSCFEFNILTNKEGKPYGSDVSLSVEYTDKRFKDRKVDYWDNVNWIRNVADGSVRGLEDLSKEDRMELVQFLGYLKKIDWL